MMPAPYSQLFLHVVWATVDRKPLVTPEIEAHVYAAISARCHQLNAVALAVGGTEDHVHLLARVPPLLSPAELVREVQTASADLILNRVRPGWLFEWQAAYGAFSVSQDATARAIQYVRNQKVLHASQSVWEEWERCQA